MTMFQHTLLFINRISVKSPSVLLFQIHFMEQNRVLLEGLFHAAQKLAEGSKMRGGHANTRNNAPGENSPTASVEEVANTAQDDGSGRRMTSYETGMFFSMTEQCLEIGHALRQRQKQSVSLRTPKFISWRIIHD
jgi:hypothetical protein